MVVVDVVGVLDVEVEVGLEDEVVIWLDVEGKLCATSTLCCL